MSLLLGEDDESSEDEQMGGEDVGEEEDVVENDENDDEDDDDAVAKDNLLVGPEGVRHIESKLEKYCIDDGEQSTREHTEERYQKEVGREQLRSPVLTPIAIRGLDSVMGTLSRRLEALRQRQNSLIVSIAREGGRPDLGVEIEGYNEALELLVLMPAYQSRLVAARKAMAVIAAKSSALRAEALKLEQEARKASLARENARMDEARKDQKLKASFATGGKVTGGGSSSPARGQSGETGGGQREKRPVATSTISREIGATNGSAAISGAMHSAAIAASVTSANGPHAKNKRKQSRIVTL